MPKFLSENLFLVKSVGGAYSLIISLIVWLSYDLSLQALKKTSPWIEANMPLLRWRNVGLFASRRSLRDSISTSTTVFPRQYVFPVRYFLSKSIAPFSLKNSLLTKDKSGVNTNASQNSSLEKKHFINNPIIIDYWLLSSDYCDCPQYLWPMWLKCLTTVDLNWGLIAHL